MEATMLFVALTSLILLAVTSMRFGADSREGIASKERELALRGIGRVEPSTTHRRQRRATGRLPLSTSKLVVPRKCVTAACGA